MIGVAEATEAGCSQTRQSKHVSFRAERASRMRYTRNVKPDGTGAAGELPAAPKP